MGVPLMRTKLSAYAVGAFFGGIGGLLLRGLQGRDLPDDFYFNISIIILCMVILGGMGNVWGVTLGRVILTWLNFQGLARDRQHRLRLATIRSRRSTSTSTCRRTRFLIFGLILVLMMLFRPEGLIPIAARAKIELRGVDGRRASAVDLDDAVSEIDIR